ncbi:MAG: accessory Sec system glycosyltransferase GtfB [Streptococcus parasanguinis]
MIWQVPELWECWTLGITTYLFDGEERRANVVLREDILSRTVDRVEWFGQGEEIVSIDVYNLLWLEKQAESPYMKPVNRYLDIYLNRQQKKSCFTLSPQGTLHQTPKGQGSSAMPVKKELQRAVLEQVLPEDEAILLMDRGLLDVVKEIPKERLAYCASNAHDLDEIKEQVSQILLVEDGLLREKKAGITALLGLVDVEQESFQPEALVMTASQEVEGLSRLVHQFPQVTFHIAALTAMGPKLTDLATRSNVRLYPGISLDKYEDLLSSCSIYLDCNQGEEVWSSSLHALENGQVLFGLKS